MLIKKLFPVLLFSLINAQNLEEILNIAKENNYKLKSYNHIINSKEYVIKQSKDSYYPTVSLYSYFSKEKYKEKYPTRTIKVNDSTFTYGINIKQNLYNPKIFASIKDAELKKEIVISERDSFLLDLYQNVLIAYFEAVANKKALKYYKIKKENYKKILANILAKKKYNYATNTQLAQAKSNYAIALNEYIKAKLTYENSIKKLKLLLLTNKDLNINGNINDNVDNLIKNSLLSYEKYKANLKNNPTIKNAFLYMKASKNELQNRKYSKYPTLDLTGSYSNSNAKDTGSIKHHYKISINFNMNLYNKQTNDSILEAKELYFASLNDYKYKINSLEMDFSKNWNNLQTDLEIVKSDKEKIIQTKEYLLQSEESFKYKLISLTDYYQAENDYFNALINFEKDKFNLIYYYITILAQTNELKEKVKILKLFLN